MAIWIWLRRIAIPSLTTRSVGPLFLKRCNSARDCIPKTQSQIKLRPCDYIVIHLLSVQSSRPDVQDVHFEGQGKNVHEPAVSVQHIAKSADYSFIKESKLVELLVQNCDSSFPDIEIDDDTIVVIRWHYLSDNKTEVTTKHLVVHESSFDIILRFQDWEHPIREFLRTRQPENSQPTLVQQKKGSNTQTNNSTTVKAKSVEHLLNVDLSKESETESNMAPSGILDSTRSSATTEFGDAYQGFGGVAREDAILDSCGDDSNEEEQGQNAESIVGGNDRTKDVQMKEFVDDSEVPVKNVGRDKGRGRGRGRVRHSDRNRDRSQLGRY